MSDSFNSRRRQQFLTENLYANSRLEQVAGLDIQRQNIVIDTVEYGKGSLAVQNDAAFVYHEKFWLWMLDYTAGEDIDSLAPRLSEVVDEFVEWHKVNLLYREALKKKFTDREVIVDISPVDFDNQIHYEDAMQLLSVALMLRDSASVQRIIKAMDSNRYRDALYENLISGYVDDPQEDFEEVMHDKPSYGLLVDMFFEDDPSKSLKLLEKYLKTWYKHQDGSRWFDGHLKIVDDHAPYYGYWAFEAGAVVYFLDLDDSSIDHMVYPKDLVAYGKKLREEDRWTSPDVPLQEQTQRLRALHGETVPKAGWWYTPALSGDQGMRLFNEGERLPDTAFTSWGEVIWYWEPERQR